MCLICNEREASKYCLYSNDGSSVSYSSKRKNYQSGNIIIYSHGIAKYKVQLNPMSKYVVYKMGGSGLGSQLLNLFAKEMYFRDMYNRSMIVDESQFGYRRSASIGVFTGYFNPQFFVLDTKDQQKGIEELNNGSNIYDYATNSNPNYVSEHTNNNSFWITGLFEYRPQLRAHYDISSYDFFREMVDTGCRHMKFNKRTVKEIHELKSNHSFPDFRKGTDAFHVRRTDKLIHESRLYKRDEYVTKLLSIARRDSIKKCFVATDDVTAIKEIRLALHTSNVTCKVYALQNEVLPTDNRYKISDALQLVTELSILTDADYFIGTFNSNIGGLVIILRCCNKIEDHHYSRSFGVDSDTWQFL